MCSLPSLCLAHSGRLSMHNEQHMLGSHIHCSIMAIPGSLMQEKPQSTAAAALAAAKAAVSSAGHGQVAVTETRRFAGKDIQVKQLTRRFRHKNQLFRVALPCPSLPYPSFAEASLCDSDEAVSVRNEHHGALHISVDSSCEE